MGELLKFERTEKRTAAIQKRHNTETQIQNEQEKFLNIYRAAMSSIINIVLSLPSEKPDTIENYKKLTLSDIFDEKTGIFKCPCCDFTTENPQGFFKHHDFRDDEKHHSWRMKNFHELLEIERTFRDKLNKSKKFKCEQCNRKFVSNEKLTDHIKRVSACNPEHPDFNKSKKPVKKERKLCIVPLIPQKTTSCDSTV